MTITLNYLDTTDDDAQALLVALDRARALPMRAELALQAAKAAGESLTLPRVLVLLDGLVPPAALAAAREAIAARHPATAAWALSRLAR